MNLLNKLFEIEPKLKPQTWVREMIDPGNTLPNVEILVPRDKNKRTIRFKGQEIGFLVLGKHENGNIKLDYITAHSDTKGCGLAAYILVIEETLNRGETFQSDSSVSGKAAHIWDTLAARGIATIRKPFVEIGGDRYSGDYRIKPR